MLAVGRQSAPRHDDMHVRMQFQRLPPGMQDHQSADLCSQVLRRGSDFQQRLATARNKRL